MWSACREARGGHHLILDVGPSAVWTALQRESPSRAQAQREKGCHVWGVGAFSVGRSGFEGPSGIGREVQPGSQVLADSAGVGAFWDGTLLYGEVQ